LCYYKDNRERGYVVFVIIEKLKSVAKTSHFTIEFNKTTFMPIISLTILIK